MPDPIVLPLAQFTTNEIIDGTNKDPVNLIFIGELAMPGTVKRIVVASSDDPWVSIERAHSMAVDWGSHFVDAGAQGHLNAASGIGWWEEGQELLDRVVAASGDGRGHVRSPSEARSVLAVSATDAAQGHYLGR